MANIANIKTILNETETLYPIKDAAARAALEELAPKVNDLWNVDQSPVLYVSKNHSRFTTINAAIDYAREYCSLTNRVTIIISAGLYQEYIDLDNNPGIDFYGLSNVTIRSSVAWRLSTLRCSNTVYVYNINFENYYTPGTGEHAGYALHADPVTGYQVFYNCSFYSDNNSAIGVGMGNNGQCNFFYCRFRSPLNAVYAHNNVTPGTSGQWLRFYNCHIETFDDSSIVRIDDAASMQNPAANSVMGLLFVECTGNNNGVVYRYGSPMQTLTYIPTDTSSYSVFLAAGSIGNESPGLNRIKEKLRIASFIVPTASASMYVRVAEAYKYDWTCTSIVYKDYTEGSGWASSWTQYSGSVSASVNEDDPDCIKISMFGAQLLRVGERVFEFIFEGVPRKDLTFPVTVTMNLP